MSRFKKLPYKKAKEVTDRYDLRPECEPLLLDDPSVADYIARLQEQDLAGDLITFLCYGLPIREAFSWALNCVESADNSWTPDEMEALAVTRAWLHKPDDRNRRLGDQAAKRCGHKNGPGWLAQAVYWSGGSLMPAGEPVVLPPDFLYAQALSGAINLTAILPDGANANERYQQYTKLGLSIAAGQ
ncbi:DUF6931 family protein [Endozoicomonadaceae bacterium StTr2]